MIEIIRISGVETPKMARLKWLPEATDDFERIYYFLLDEDNNTVNKAAYSLLQGTN
jgi:plasmid stabilization system protein ParE